MAAFWFFVALLSAGGALWLMQPTRIAPLAAVPAPAPTPDRHRSTVSFVGDVMLGGGVAEVARRRGTDTLFARVDPWLHAGDAVVGNLECVLSTRGAPTASKPEAALRAHREWLLRGSPEDAAALARANFAAMTLANNHSMDYRGVAMDDSLAALHGAGIASTGAGDDLTRAQSPAIFERAGIRFAVLGVSEILPQGSWATRGRSGVAPGRGLARTSLDPAFDGAMARRVRAWRDRVDVVVVYEHWGTELVGKPTDDQRAFAHAMIDAGAQLVVGAHPHVLGPIENYRGGVIAYSLGNFVFDAYPGAAARSAILQVRFDGARVAGWEAVPVVITGGIPHAADERSARAIARALEVGPTCHDGLRMPGACVTTEGTRRAALHHSAHAD
ncbi:CapA family protein [bacterium]|nr:MAG: CapA family protein [bacterium]